MFERARRRYPRQSRCDRRVGAVVGALIAAPTLTRIFVMGVRGLSRDVAMVAYAVLLTAFLCVEFTAMRLARPVTIAMDESR